MPTKDITAFGRVRRHAASVAAINAANAGTIAAVFAAKWKHLDLEMSAYNALEDTAPVRTALVGQAFADRAALETAFVAAVNTQATAEADAITAINDATALTMAAAIVAQHDVLGLDTTDYDALGDASSVNTTLAAGTYATMAAIKTAFDAAVAAQKASEAAVAAVNGAAAETIDAVLAAQAETLGLDLTDYDALDAAGKTAVGTAMVGKAFADAAAVKAAFDAAVEAAQGA